jgi:hypothetical protein
MAKRRDKKAERVRQIFNRSNHSTRMEWEYINQKGYDFSNDNQLTEVERSSLEEQGMPTFTINRIAPVVEMLNYYATANTPRWQAVAAEGSDTDIAAIFSDMADYIWYGSDGGTLYGNTINDAITKSIGWMMVSVNPDADHGMGEVELKQPEPFDIYVDPKARDILFRDAGFILVRKVMPKEHLKTMFPEFKRKIANAGGQESGINNLTEKAIGGYRKDFGYKDISDAESISLQDGEHDTLIEFFEMFEKIKVSYMNVFYKIPPDPQALKVIAKEVKTVIAELKAELSVKMLEQQAALEQQLKEGKILKERYSLEMHKMQKQNEQALEQATMELQSKLESEKSKISNKIITEKEYEILLKDDLFKRSVVKAVQFYDTRIRQTCVAGDKLLYEKVLPSNITEYPLVPFHYKWTGTPYPVSAVSPLIGKQREINKSHQIMVHNASLGSSLRWMHEEGSIDTDYWEKYSSSPGALLPIRPGAAPPTPVQPAPLSNAFFTIVQEGKGDMEYLAGIYGAMQGDTKSQHETFRGMMAMDEYGTRRVKQWMKNAIEPALKQLGIVTMQYSQSVYTAHKVFRVVQPNNIKQEKEVEINVPIYNDYGKSIGKFNDYASAKFDIRIIAGSTLPINRWAYLEELKQLLQLGVVDDMAVLAETDIRNKENIAKRKSVYSQLKKAVDRGAEKIKDLQGTIETLERQLVQAGIKGKVMQAEMEVDRTKVRANEEVKSRAKDAARDIDTQKKMTQNKMTDGAAQARQRAETDLERERMRLAAATDKQINKLELNTDKSINKLDNSSKES